MLTPEQRDAWERDGFFVVKGFADPSVVDAMEARVVELARAKDAGDGIGDALVLPEDKLKEVGEHAEERLSKLFRVHRQEPVFRAFACDEGVLDPIVSLLGPGIDCFLSQFIFKLPGALGQPWHQDAFYFPFDRRPQVGVWLAVTEATLDNGPLWVLPGSHRERVHDVVPDAREHASLGYVEIVDHDMDGAVPVLLEPGDLLFFHSHLMHKSTDNGSDQKRAAMVYHFAEAGTVDHSLEKLGFVPPNIDWMPVRRHVETEIEIAASPDVVHSVLRDGERYPEWNPYLERIDGTIAAGEEIVAHGRLANGDAMPMPVRVLEDGPAGMRWEGGAPDRRQFRGDHRFDLEALPDGRTRLRHHEVFTGTLVPDLLGPEGEAAIRANFERMNEALRVRCEGL